MGKRGYFYLIDAFIGLSILVISLLVILSFNAFQPSPSQTMTTLDDYMNVLLNTQIRDLDNAYIFSLRQSGVVQDDATIFQQIAMFYVDGKYAYARDTIQNVSFGLLPSHKGFYYAVNGTMLYNRSYEKFDNSSLVLVSRKITYVRNGAGLNATVFGPVLTEVALWELI
ncbi:hypothetical protein C4573_02010 [Candidatus Woesearchaeota archaeon]|nr:MAG: hypothetical protein C4573_02010 [Candidatus Woesearchaeota archaeon]